MSVVEKRGEKFPEFFEVKMARAFDIQLQASALSVSVFQPQQDHDQTIVVENQFSSFGAIDV